MVERAQLEPGVYVTPALPRHWIVATVAGEIWKVHTGPAGWADREPYAGPTAGLEPAAPAIAWGALLGSNIPPGEIGQHGAASHLWLTPEEAAAESGLAAGTWRWRAGRGEVPGAIKKGKQWLIPRSALRDLPRHRG